MKNLNTGDLNFMVTSDRTVETKMTVDSDKLAYKLPPDRVHHFQLEQNRLTSYKTVYFFWGESVQIS